MAKALEKDAGRRYASAAALSEDLGRWLTSQPILPRPPSTTYQLRKFAARNTTGLFGGATLPEDLGIEKWYQNEVDLHDGQPTVVAMWEAWCPYSYRAIPKLEGSYTEYEKQGLRIVGITKITRSATEQNGRKIEGLFESHVPMRLRTRSSALPGAYGYTSAATRGASGIAA